MIDNVKNNIDNQSNDKQIVNALQEFQIQVMKKTMNRRRR